MEQIQEIRFTDLLCVYTGSGIAEENGRCELFPPAPAPETGREPCVYLFPHKK